MDWWSASSKDSSLPQDSQYLVTKGPKKNLSVTIYFYKPSPIFGRNSRWSELARVQVSGILDFEVYEKWLEFRAPQNPATFVNAQWTADDRNFQTPLGMNWNSVHFRFCCTLKVGHFWKQIFVSSLYYKWLECQWKALSQTADVVISGELQKLFLCWICKEISFRT